MTLWAGTHACGCDMTSETLTITGDGSAGDPFVLDGGSLTGVSTYSSLRDPSAMPNGTAFFVEEANELAVVRGGKYFIPGQKFWDLSGTLTMPSSGTVVLFGDTIFTPSAAFEIETPYPAATPFTISDGAISMRPYFHPAEFTCYSVRPFNKDPLEFEFTFYDITVTVGGDPKTYLLNSEYERWYNDADHNATTIPIGRGQNAGDNSEILNPFMLGSGAMRFQYNISVPPEGSLTNPSFMSIGLNWSIIP